LHKMYNTFIAHINITQYLYDKSNQG